MLTIIIAAVAATAAAVAAFRTVKRVKNSKNIKPAFGKSKKALAAKKVADSKDVLTAVLSVVALVGLAVLWYLVPMASMLMLDRVIATAIMSIGMISTLVISCNKACNPVPSYLPVAVRWAVGLGVIATSVVNVAVLGLPLTVLSCISTLPLFFYESCKLALMGMIVKLAR